MHDSDLLVGRLVTMAPELAPLLDEHLADQEGELLAYIFMADVARWLHQHAVDEPARVLQVLGWLDAQFGEGDFDTRNLIDVGIIEMLPEMPDGEPVLRLLPPRLRDRAEVAGLLGS